MKRLACSLLFISALIVLPRLFAAEFGLLDETRSAIQEWVRTEQLISQESKEWREEETFIGNISSILSAEQRELNEQITLAQEIASRADEERAGLVEQLATYQEISELLEVRIADYERQLLLISNYLPESLKLELAPRLSRLNNASETLAPSLGERAQTVLNIVSGIQSFDANITLTTEIVPNDNNDQVEVQVLYLGLSRAFFINGNATVGGYGVPTESGWQWQQVNELIDPIAGTIASYESRISPQLFNLPMQVQP